jgi:hypothetical protein
MYKKIIHSAVEHVSLQKELIDALPEIELFLLMHNTLLEIAGYRKSIDLGAQGDFKEHCESMIAEAMVVYEYEALRTEAFGVRRGTDDLLHWFDWWELQMMKNDAFGEIKRKFDEGDDLSDHIPEGNWRG